MQLWIPFEYNIPCSTVWSQQVCTPSDINKTRPCLYHAFNVIRDLYLSSSLAFWLKKGRDQLNSIENWWRTNSTFLALHAGDRTCLGWRFRFWMIPCALPCLHLDEEGFVNTILPHIYNTYRLYNYICIYSDIYIYIHIAITQGFQRRAYLSFSSTRWW